MFKNFDNQKLEINYKFTPLNILLFFSFISLVSFYCYIFFKGYGISESTFVNAIVYLILVLLFWFVIFKNIIHNKRKCLYIKDNRLMANNSMYFDFSEGGDVLFVYENINGVYSKLLYCSCYLEQGFGVKQKRYYLCSYIHENECVKLYSELLKLNSNIKLEHRCDEDLLSFCSKK